MSDIEVRKSGRPLKYKTAEELEIAIDDYFDHCDNRLREIHTKEGDVIAINSPEPYTVSGLAYALGMDRESLNNYSKREAFFGTVKDAKTRVQIDIERRLMETSNQAGAIFNLKNNFGYKDKSEVDQNIRLPRPILDGASVKQIEEVDVHTDDSN